MLHIFQQSESKIIKWNLIMMGSATDLDKTIVYIFHFFLKV